MDHETFVAATLIHPQQTKLGWFDLNTQIELSSTVCSNPIKLTFLAGCNLYYIEKSQVQVLQFTF